MKNKIILNLLVVLAAIYAQAQQIVATSGGYFENDAGSLSFTVGEPITETFQNGDIILTQGFQQPYDFYLTQLLNIPYGWSGVSSYIDPMNKSVEGIFTPYENYFIILASMSEFYYPDGNVNTIGNWDYHTGYKVKAINNFAVSLTGTRIHNPTLGLPEGWSLIPVLSSNPVNVEELFSPVSLVMAKDVAGTGVYWPQFGINTLNVLEPGKAYFVLLSEAGMLDFAAMKKTSSKGTLTGFHPAQERLSGLGITPTPSTHTIAILPSVLKDIEVGTIIAAYDQNGNCFGATEIASDNNSITIFGDDPTTVEKDGFIDGELIFFKNQSGLETSGARLTDLEPVFDQNLPQANGLFTENGLSAITSIKASTGIAGVNFLQHVHIFPNPSDGMVNISGIIPGTALTVTDLHGKVLVETISDSENTKFDLTDYQPGVYFIKISQNGTNIFRKIVLK